MRLLVIGQDSAIGGAILRTAAAGGDTAIGTSRRSKEAFPLDLAAPVLPPMPEADVAIFVAAMSKFADCRDNPTLARRINIEAPLGLARKMQERGTRLLLLSTSAVFNGSRPFPLEDDVPCPASDYGALKAEAEREFLALGAGVLRMTKVLSPEMPLLRGWIAALAAGRPVNAFADLPMAPISLGQAVNAAIALSQAKVGGIYHLSAANDISYVDAACHIAARLGAPLSLVQPASAKDSGLPISQIVSHAALGGQRLIRLTGRQAPNPVDVLDQTFSPLLQERRP